MKKLRNHQHLYNSPWGDVIVCTQYCASRHSIARLFTVWWKKLWLVCGARWKFRVMTKVINVHPLEAMNIHRYHILNSYQTHKTKTVNLMVVLQERPVGYIHSALKNHDNSSNICGDISFCAKVVDHLNNQRTLPSLVLVLPKTLHCFVSWWTVIG